MCHDTCQWPTLKNPRVPTPVLESGQALPRVKVSQEDSFEHRLKLMSMIIFGASIGCLNHFLQSLEHQLRFADFPKQGFPLHCHAENFEKVMFRNFAKVLFLYYA
jgi:hypothetical protein